MKVLLSRHKRRIRIIKPRSDSDRVLLRLQARVDTRCTKDADGTIAVALVGSEVRLLCGLYWRIYGRARYRIFPTTRRANIRHVPGRKEWNYEPVFTARDRLVHIGWETRGLQRRPVVRLTPADNSRVRNDRNIYISWWLTIPELDALARLYGRPLPSSCSTTTEAAQQITAARDRLRRTFERRYPELARCIPMHTARP